MQAKSDFFKMLDDKEKNIFFNYKIVKKMGCYHNRFLNETIKVTILHATNSE